MLSRGQVIGLVVILLFAGFFAAGGYLTYRDQRDGVPVVATITDCTERLAKQGGDICRGRWTIGDPVFGDGRFVTGTVEGVGHGDEGKKVEVRANGDRAVVPGLRFPIIMWSIAAIILGFGGYQLIMDARRSRRPA
jgi:hypothetical protein